MFRSALRFAAGAAIAATVWTWLAPSYVALIAPASRHLVNLDPRLRHLDVKPEDGKLILRGGVAAPDLPLGWFAADQVTYNVILLIGLFATTTGLLRSRTLSACLLALAGLAVTHVVAVAFGIEYTYATGGGPWSDAHYGGTEQDCWKAVFYSYQLAGMYAVSFALWWVSGSSEGRRDRARPAA